MKSKGIKVFSNLGIGLILATAKCFFCVEGLIKPKLKNALQELPIIGSKD